MNFPEEVNVFVDGASRGNPGHSAVGVFFTTTNHQPLMKYKQYLGETTNNAAEYMGLLYALKLATQNHVSKLNVFSDSNLVVNQINGKFRVSNSRLRPLYDEAMKTLKLFSNGYSITHIPREQNSIADKLANEALDEQKFDN